MKKSILVSGANGQLGQAIRSIAFQFPDLQIDFVERDKLDLSLLGLKNEHHYFPNWLNTSNYDFYIHAAAYTAVDQAEKEVKLCFQINELAVNQLANHFAKTKTKFIYISTDYIYHTSQNTPFKETDLPYPKSVYAKSKLAGEEAVKKSSNNWLIFRTSWVYGNYGKNFINTIDRLGKEKDVIKVVFDQIGSPTWVIDLANMLLTIISNGKANEINGLFNYANEGVTSWYDLAVAIINHRNYNVKIIPIRSSDFSQTAPRPSFSVMDKSYFKEKFNLNIPHWLDSLHQCLSI